MCVKRCFGIEDYPAASCSPASGGIPCKEFLIDLLFARYTDQTLHFLRILLIVSPWTMIENTTTMYVINTMMPRCGLCGIDSASATAIPPRNPPQVSVLTAFLRKGICWPNRPKGTPTLTSLTSHLRFDAFGHFKLLENSEHGHRIRWRYQGTE